MHFKIRGAILSLHCPVYSSKLFAAKYHSILSYDHEYRSRMARRFIALENVPFPNDDPEPCLESFKRIRMNNSWVDISLNSFVRHRRGVDLERIRRAVTGRSDDVWAQLINSVSR